MSKHIADEIIAEVAKRKEQGIKTYGQALEPFNKRDSTQDALEEALDLAHYIKQWQIERKEIIDFVKFAYDYSNDPYINIDAHDLLKKLGEL